MAFFAKPIDPPPESDGVLAYVLWIAREEHGCIKAQPDSAITQDLGICGMDVDDFAMKLAERYGPWVTEWPWCKFTDLNEGIEVLGCFAVLFSPIMMVFRLARGFPALRGRPRIGRFELNHIAKVLEKGEWMDP